MYLSNHQNFDWILMYSLHRFPHFLLCLLIEPAVLTASVSDRAQISTAGSLVVTHCPAPLINVVHTNPHTVRRSHPGIRSPLAPQLPLCAFWHQSPGCWLDFMQPSVYDQPVAGLYWWAANVTASPVLFQQGELISPLPFFLFLN